MRVRYALDRATLMVCNLGPSVKAEELREALRQFGHIIECRIDHEAPEHGGRSKQVGYVEFSKRAVASKVQQLLSENLFILSSSPQPLRVEFAVDNAPDLDASHQPVPNVRGVDPPPHFAMPGTLEFDFALRWRELQLAHRAEEERLAEVHRQEREVLRQEQVQMYQHAVQKFRAVDNPAVNLHIGGPYTPAAEADAKDAASADAAAAAEAQQQEARGPKRPRLQ